VRVSLEKKDTKIYLDPAEHQVLAALADARGVTNQQLASEVVREFVQRQAHDASVIAQVAERAGILRDGKGAGRESSGFVRASPVGGGND
jgi:hypothetical protein